MKRTLLFVRGLFINKNGPLLKRKGCLRPTSNNKKPTELYAPVLIGTDITAVQDKATMQWRLSFFPLWLSFFPLCYSRVLKVIVPISLIKHTCDFDVCQSVLLMSVYQNYKYCSNTSLVCNEVHLLPVNCNKYLNHEHNVGMISDRLGLVSTPNQS